MNPTCTIKAEQVAKTRKRRKLTRSGAEKIAEVLDGWRENAVDAAKRAGARRKKAEEVARMEPMECPKKALIEAARAGDPDAINRADNIYGKTWRKR